MVFKKRTLIIAAASVTFCGLLSTFAITAYADKESESGSNKANSITLNPVGYYGETAETALPVIENDLLNETSEILLLNTVGEALMEETETAEMSEETVDLSDEAADGIVSSKFIVPSAEEIELDLQGEEHHENAQLLNFIPAGYGSEVYAAESGIVMYKKYVGGYGISLCMLLEDGNYAVYSHFAIDDTICFDEGTEIAAGQLIGLAGDSGNIKECGVGYSYMSISPEDGYKLGYERACELARERRERLGGLGGFEQNQ